jgi:disulfide bond formation protein DsbB
MQTGKKPQEKMQTARAFFPDPKNAHGPYRPFTCDPGWSEAWWWLGIPLFVAVFTLGSYWLNPGWYDRYVLPEGYGILEFSHFVIPLIGLFVAVRLLFDPFVRARPFVLTVSIIGALSCLYIAGEEMSWGQHFFHWNTPEYWAEVNRQQETNLHNTYAIFEKTPRSILEISIAVGGLGVPIAAIFYPWLRACRVSLFLPANATVPLAIGAMFFKVVDRLEQGHHVGKLLDRPSETIETYLYVFIVAYLVIYARRIRELEAAEGAPK